MSVFSTCGHYTLPEAKQSTRHSFTLGAEFEVVVSRQSNSVVVVRCLCVLLFRFDGDQRARLARICAASNDKFIRSSERSTFTKILEKRGKRWIASITFSFLAVLRKESRLMEINASRWLSAQILHFLHLKCTRWSGGIE